MKTSDVYLSAALVWYEAIDVARIEPRFGRTPAYCELLSWHMLLLWAMYSAEDR